MADVTTNINNWVDGDKYVAEKAKQYTDNKINNISLYVELTQAEYNALTDAEKNNGTVYFIRDGATVTGLVDQTYNATSENAQSGKAVAEAINGEDTGWLTLQNNGADVSGAKYRKKNGIVYIQFVNVSVAPGDTFTQIGLIPEGFRPNNTTRFVAYYGVSSICHLQFSVTGVVSVSKYKDASVSDNGTMYVAGSYPV